VRLVNPASEVSRAAGGGRPIGPVPARASPERVQLGKLPVIAVNPLLGIGDVSPSPVQFAPSGVTAVGFPPRGQRLALQLIGAEDAVWVILVEAGDAVEIGSKSLLFTQLMQWLV